MQLSVEYYTRLLDRGFDCRGLRAQALNVLKGTG